MLLSLFSAAKKLNFRYNFWFNASLTAQLKRKVLKFIIKGRGEVQEDYIQSTLLLNRASLCPRNITICLL